MTQAVHLFLVWLADKMNLEHGKSVWGLGYSCVLFALMTTIILKGDTQCPVNLYGMCFPTYEFKLLPFPSTCTGLLMCRIRINLYPFVLLVVMKLIVPISSFFGHLAGILVG